MRVFDQIRDPEIPINLVNANVSNLKVLGRMKNREIYVLVVIGTSVAQLVRAPNRRTEDLWF